MLVFLGRSCVLVTRRNTKYIKSTVMFETSFSTVCHVRVTRGEMVVMCVTMETVVRVTMEMAVRVTMRDVPYRKCTLTTSVVVIIAENKNILLGQKN